MRAYIDFGTISFAPSKFNIPIEISKFEPDDTDFQYFDVFCIKDDAVRVEEFWFENTDLQTVIIDFQRVPGLFFIPDVYWPKCKIIDGMRYPSEGLELVDIDIAELIIKECWASLSPETIQNRMF